MGAVQAVHAAVLGALGGHAPFRGAINGLYDGRIVRASPPYAVLDESIATDWSTKDVRGREVRVRLSIFDTGETPGRLRMIAGHAEDAIAAMPRALDGWHIGSVGFLSARAGRAGAKGQMRVVIDYRVRVMEALDGG